MALYILSGIVAVFGVAIGIWQRRGLPESLSALAYVWGWWWTVWLWAVAFLQAPLLMERLGDGWAWLGFAMTAALVATGAWPLTDAGKVRWHYATGVAAWLAAAGVVCRLGAVGAVVLGAATVAVAVARPRAWCLLLEVAAWAAMACCMAFG